MAYNYGPPPPAPAPAPPNGAAGGYSSSYGQGYQPPSQRGGHHAGRGRGGADRGGYHQQAPAYSYGQQPPQPSYGQQNPAPYPAGPHPPQGGYPQQPPQQQQQQQWHPEHGQQHAQPAAAHAPLAAQNYHPNYAPQMYQPQLPYAGGQPPYPPQPQYAQGYAAPAPSAGPHAQQWSSHPPPPQSQPPYGGGGRGGRSYNDRGGGPKSQMMGPPIRIGFDGSNPQAPHAAPVSTPYPPQSYGAPQAPAPYPPVAAYQGYASPAPYMASGPPQYDGHPGHHSRQHNRGGYQNHSYKPRPPFGGDKFRDRKRGPNGTNAHTPPPPHHHQKPDAASAGKKKKRKTNTLGLTPGDDSDDDDEDEEERLNEMYGAEAPNPISSSDIAAWIAERKANFPTKAKIEAKKAAAKAQNGDAHKNGEGGNAFLEKQQQKAEKLRKQLEKVESSIKRKREQQDEGDEMRNIDLGSSSGDSSDDDRPEVMSSRQDSNNLPPPPRKADPTKHCKYYSTGGNCGKRGKCRFVHDSAVREAALREQERNGGRMTLQQRLILNDKGQEDLTIVQTLKYLHDRGLIKKEMTAAGSKGSSTAAASNAQLEQSKPAIAQSQPHLPPVPIKKEPANGLPPIPPASVVSSHAPAPKYSGWNLGGFGNNGVRDNEV